MRDPWIDQRRIAQLIADLDEARAQIAVKDEKIAEYYSWADTMLRKIEVLEAQIAETAK